MTTNEKVEGFLINLGLTFEELENGSWLINDEDKGLEQVTVVTADTLVIVRVNVMQVPSENREEFYRTLLELNASDLIHGAYAIEEDAVILVDTLEAETIDIEEMQASMDAIGLALAQHYAILSKYRKSQ